MRGYAKRYDGFKTHKLACTITEGGKLYHLIACRTPVGGLILPCVVRSPPSYYFPALLAFSGFLCINYARPVQSVRLSRVNKPPQYSFICCLNFSLQDEYAREFTKFKPDKKLQWLSHLGTVQLDIELEDRTVSAEVLPLEAALIGLFSESGG